MEFKGAMGGIYRLTEWITRLAATNLLWAICSSPFLFFMIMKLLVMQQNLANESLQMNWAIAIVAPLTLFPATAALFTVVRKWNMGDTDVPIFRTFFAGYKENYKQSLIGGIFYTLLFAIMYLDYTVYMTQFRNMQLVGIIMLVLLLLLFVSLFNFFSMVVHYHMSIGLIIKNAVLLTLIRPFRVFSTLLGSGLLFYIGLRYPVLFIFFIMSIIAWFAFFNFYATYNKMQEQMQKLQLQKEEEEAAALAEKSDDANEEVKGAEVADQKDFTQSK
ncbi:YesL family protein [Paenibacillus sp. TC-CSREp1]|uniref:YesL family protein n=1 Tax=Paenibacillus sp. TC-CSREp1 TaxID=3410089 RepID=UPI003CF06EEE